MKSRRSLIAVPRRALRRFRRAQRMRRLRLPLEAPFPEAAYREASDAFLTHTGRSIASVLDIGANFGQCAAYMAERNAIGAKNVVCVEAHPDLAATIRQRHPFLVLEGAVGVGLDDTPFFARRIGTVPARPWQRLLGTAGTDNRAGMSSLLRHEQDVNDDVLSIRVPCVSLEHFLEESGRSFDFAKIDVEGAALKALESLGDRIDRIGSIQIEAETRRIWAGQSLWPDVRTYLEDAGFELTIYRLDRHFLQCESFWIRKELIRSFEDQHKG